MMLKDSTAVTELARENMSLAQKIKSWIDSYLEKIKGAFRNVKPKSLEAYLLSENQTELEKIQRLWDTALKDAVRNNSDNNTETEKKYDLKNVPSQKEMTDNIKIVADMNPVIELEGTEFPKGAVPLVTQVTDFFNSIGNKISTPYGEVILNKKSVKSSVGHGVGRIKAVAFKAVPDVIKKGKIIDYEKNWKGRNYDAVIFASKIKIAESEYYMAVIVKVNKADNTYYLHEVATQKKEDATVFKNGSFPYGSPVTAPTSIHSLLQKIQNVNNNSAQENKNYSLKDSAGNELSKEQQEYFKDSKVRDEDGNLLVMYHGTPNGTFTEFKDWQYFTGNKEYADVYQSPGASSLSVKQTADAPKIYETYLNITKPFDTRIPEVRELWYDEYYRQWGTGTDLVESGLPDWMDGMDIAEFIEENDLDYDGIILDEGGVGGYGDEVKSRGISYVVRSSNQIKNIDNKTPTSDSDIRYSLKEKQLDIILKSNPAADSYHTWIRTVDDIHTFEETLNDPDWEGWESSGFDPDYDGEMAKKALESGEITVYSSYPIKQGVFVSPSYMEAESYSGDGNVYTKRVKLSDVAWIDPTQGQYAKTDSDMKFSLKDTKDVFGFTVSKNARINEDLLEELSIHDPTAEVDLNGNVTVYHRTSQQSAEMIHKTGIMTAKEDALFFSSKEDGYAGDYGNTIVKLKIPSTVLEVNDIFDGEVHFDIPIRYKNGGFRLDVSRYLLNDDNVKFSLKSVDIDEDWLYNKNNPLSWENRAKPNSRSSLNWVYNAKIFSTVENKLFHEKISEINQGSKAFEQNTDGEYMLPIENKIVFTDGNYDSPYIREIIEVLVDNSTEYEDIKRRIFDVEKGKSGKQETAQTIEQVYGAGIICSYRSGNDGVYGWSTGRREGKTRRGVIANYLRKQNRGRNDTKVNATQKRVNSEIKYSLRDTYNSTTELAKDLKKELRSSLSVTELDSYIKYLTDTQADIMSAADYDVFRDTARSYAEAFVDSSNIKQDIDDSQRKEVASYFRGKHFRMTPELRAEVEYQYGSYRAFHAQMFGKGIYFSDVKALHILSCRKRKRAFVKTKALFWCG